jgi:hypothetical protein
MSELSIKIEGYPERVQRIADAIENIYPDMLVWVMSDEETGATTVKIEGYEMPSMPIQTGHAA